ncbi:carbohydrate ABC transporter permease [Shouchella clausii]|jgi:multiple sugar transport system permease protein|uniref:carbohydrate ABC transporter permease n=1 Tax=Shouchella TaxID=2893057 RepID=UPI0007DBF78D|nr:sugar ABC transporter permease [Shouchella clausii]MCM3311117.1 sugar ABC transporter permease [Psychrobacillus sp. MER TA 17]MCR1287015.1 sugar ABC transporter permease [Shouchella clausii]MDO7266781.1 sugar ABC transporter permease [Shouchella clausii]MEB5471440.1 sugar ABC transporter permease [Shouchella clausii]WQG94837.1 sugar ABC transporter permease [Shouchella clausii]
MIVAQPTYPRALSKSANKTVSIGARREEKYFWLFISPWLVGFLLFIGGPILASLYFSFTDYAIMDTATFVGLQNFINLFSDPLFYRSLFVTFAYAALAIPFTMIVGLGLAMLLNMKIKGQAFFRTFFYAPSIISGVSVAFLWMWILNPQFGIVNSILYELFGIQGPGWFTDPYTVIPSFVLMQLTAVGSTMIIFLASLQQLPKELYEAAAIDGAGAWRRFRNITVPLISPVILFNGIIALISSFQIFTQAYVITDGGPDWMSYFYVYYLFETAFFQNRIGYASAQAWILFLIIFALTFLSLYVSRKSVHYEYDK